MTDVTIFVVDGDEQSRDALCRTFDEQRFHTAGYSSLNEFLDAYDASRPGCIVAGLDNPGSEGVELQRRLRRAGCLLPVVVVTSASSITAAVRVMQCGAVDYVTKPYKSERLNAAIDRALDRESALREARTQRSSIIARLGTLTAREKEVLRLVVSGMPTKTIAHKLGTSRNTVQNQRASILRKMQARSVVDVVRMVMLAQLQGDPAAVSELYTEPDTILRFDGSNPPALRRTDAPYRADRPNMLPMH